MRTRISYWLNPIKEFLPSTGCRPTGRSGTVAALARREWSCPDHYPMLPINPERHSYTWYNPGLGTDDVTDAQRNILKGISESAWPEVFEARDVLGVPLDQAVELWRGRESRRISDAAGRRSDALTEQYRSEAPGWGAQEWLGVSLGTLGIAAAGIAGLWYLLKGE